MLTTRPCRMYTPINRFEIAANSFPSLFFPPTDKTTTHDKVSDGPSKQETEEAKAIAAELPNVPKADPSS